MVYINIERLEFESLKDEINEPKEDLGKALSDEVTYQGTSKAVTRERHSISDKVIFVDNLPTSFDKNKFIELFIQFGEILDVKFLKHKTGAETGYGFVEFAQEENGKKAINELHWKVFESRNIRVSRAKPPTRKVSETNLYVENVPIKWTDEMLTSHFSKICEITSARVLTNRKNEESRGVGFVHCVSHDEAKKALEWIRGEKSRKNGLRLLVKFAKIPRMERKAQKGLEVEGEATQQGKSDQSTKDVEEVKSASNREANEPSEVEQQIEGSQLKKNWCKRNMPHHLVSQGKGVKNPTNFTVRDQKNHRRSKIMRKNSQRDRMIQKGRRKQHNRVNTNALNTDEYTHHLDNYAYQPQLIRPNSRLSDRKTKHPDNHKIPWVRGKPRQMQPDGNFSFRGGPHNSCASPLSTSGRYHHMSSSTNARYQNCSRRSNMKHYQWAPPVTCNSPTAYMWAPPMTCSSPQAYQWAPPTTPTPINQVPSPLRSVCMMQVRSPVSEYEQKVGWPGQFVSTPRSVEEQRFVCTNKISHEQMFGYTNVHTLSTNMHAQRVNSSGSSPVDRTTHGLLQHIGNFSMNEKADGGAYHIQSPSRKLHSRVGYSGMKPSFGEMRGNYPNVGQQNIGGNEWRSFFSPMVSSKQGKNPNPCRWPGPLYTANHYPRSVSQSSHNEQCWSSTSSCSGMTSVIGEQPIRRDQTYPGPGGFNFFGKTQNPNLEVNKLYFPLTPSFDPTAHGLQQPSCSTSINGSEWEFEKQSQDLGNTLQQPSEEKNAYPGQTGFFPHVNLMKLTSYTDRSNHGRSMSPVSSSVLPQRRILQGSGSLFMTQVYNSQPVAQHQHCQYRSTTSTSSLHSDDLIPIVAQQNKLEKERFVLGSFPVDVTLKSRNEPFNKFKFENRMPTPCYKKT